MEKLTIDLKNKCQDCGHYEAGYCKKLHAPKIPLMYACHSFLTPSELQAEKEAIREAKLQREMVRLNFILTAVYISATSTQQLLEYFDAQFEDKKTESNWRHKRAHAAKEIQKCAERIRTLFHHNFMQDTTKLMTADGTKPFDVDAYDAHEDDARHWSLMLLYHLDRCWQSADLEIQMLGYYKAMTDNGIFDERDYRQFTKRQ